MQSGEKKFRISVLVVSDYEAGAEKTWRDERAILAALADQDINEPFLVYLLENTVFAPARPDHFREIYPHIVFHFVDAEKSADMLNATVAGIDSDYIAIMEADCLPTRTWLRSAVSVLDSNRDYDAVSGRTLYGRETATARVLSLLHRAYADVGRSGRTRHVANNGTLYRRRLLLDFPYPPAITPFAASWQRNLQMQKSNAYFYFSSDMEMLHAFDGFRFLLDYHRNMGYASMSVRNNPSLLLLAELIYRAFRKAGCSIMYKSRSYLRWHDYPLALALLFLLPWLEIPGMLDCLKHRQAIPHTAYR